MGSNKANRVCFKSNRPALYEALKVYEESSQKDSVAIKVYSEETDNKEYALFVEKDGSRYRLNSIYNPTHEAEQWVKQFKIQEINNVVLMYGLGNGVFLRNILRRLHKNDIVLVYEPSIDIFLFAVDHYDMTEILSDRRILLVVEELNVSDYHFALRQIMNVTNINTAVICTHPCYNVMFVQNSIFFWKEIKDSYTYAIMDVNTQVVFGEKFIDNILKNTRYLKESNTIEDIKTKLPINIPAIVVAAGPSVEENITELRKAKGKAVIFAVDRILDYLLDSGIEPDFVVTLDPAKPVEYFTKREDVRIPLIAFMQTSHDVLQKHKGRKLFCNCSSFLSGAYHVNGLAAPDTSSSASVATVAFTVCYELGFKTIVLVGQDLAYKNDVTHAGNVKEAISHQGDTMVDGIHGGKVRSRTDWRNFLIWYEDMLEMHKELTVIDVKTEGAKINGATLMPLNEAIQKYSNQIRVPENFMDCFQPTFDKDQLLCVRAYLEENMDILDTIKSKSKDAISDCKYLISEYKNNTVVNSKMNATAKKIVKINNYINNQQIYSLIDKYVMSSSVNDVSELYHFTEDSREDNIRTYERAINIFKAILDSLDFIKPRLEEAIKKLI